MENSVYWVWLQEAFGVGSEIPMRIHLMFPGGVEGFFRAGPTAWREFPAVTPQQIGALCGFSLDQARARLEQAAAAGWTALTPECGRYPELLKQIGDPPAVLYVKGNWPDFSAVPPVGIAGAREASQLSRNTARRIASQLAEAGAVLVSGIAPGVDRCALFEALRGKGRVVCVLPAEKRDPYPEETARLCPQILEQGGALATEFFGVSQPVRGTFHVRNRLITGLSFGVVLIQAKLRSGTMIYASRALEQNREVMVYPGPPGDRRFEGSRLLLKEGAAPVWNGRDVLAALPAYCRGEGLAEEQTE